MALPDVRELTGEEVAELLGGLPYDGAIPFPGFFEAQSCAAAEIRIDVTSTLCAPAPAWGLLVEEPRFRRELGRWRAEEQARWFGDTPTWAEGGASLERAA
jgi:hypothetical protein